MKLGIRLAIPFVLLFCLFAGGGITYFTQYRQRGLAMADSAEREMKITSLLASIQVQEQLIERNVFAQLYDRSIAHEKAVNDAQKRIDARMAELREIITTDEGKHIFAQYMDSSGRAIRFRDDVIAAIRSSDAARIQPTLRKWTLEADISRAWLEDLSSFKRQLLREAVAEQRMLDERLVELATVLGLLGLSIIALSLFVLRRTIVRPIEALTEAAREIERGHLDTDIPHSGGGEIADLAQAFASMTEKVRDTYGLLEGRVLERTKDVLRAEAEQRANAERLALMLEQMPLGAVALDQQDQVMEVNALACQYFGFTDPDQVRGMSVDVFRRQMVSRIKNVREYLQAVAAQKQNPFVPHTMELHLHDGTMLVRDTVPVFAQGKFHGLFILFRDVTRERRIDASKSEFMALASHQLRTPLTIVKWSASRILKSLKGTLAPEQARLFGELRHATDRMAGTINTMLAISRLEAGKGNVELSSFPLAELFEEIQRLLVREAERRKLTFAVECPAQCILHTDRFVLREILANLVGNAIKYTPAKGYVALHASCNSDRVIIDVRDTGYGIPAHLHDKIFAKFFRGDNILNRETEGTGLGLYLVSLLCPLIGGSLTFTSQEGTGTTFTLTLPFDTPLHASPDPARRG